MNERSNLIPVTEDEVREHYGRITEAVLLNNGGGLFDAVEAWVQLRQSRYVDPRIARIEALFADDHWWATSDHKIRREALSILRGEA